MNTISFTQALNEALHQEMERDGDIFIMGSDVAFGGRAGVTKGLTSRFGRERVMDLPVSEEIFVGVAMGAAQLGLRPVVELVHSTLPLVAGMDFLRLGIWKWICGDKISLPVVIRIRTGEEVGPELSQSIVSFLSGLRGLTVVAPSTPYQAKGLLVSALRYSRPVVIIEHSGVFKEKEQVPDSPYEFPFGKSEYVLRGEDVSIISYSVLTKRAVRVAENLTAQKISAEVLDLVSLRPLDGEKILTTAAKTRKVLVLSDESVISAGLPLQIYQMIKEGVPKAKIALLGAKEIPVPLGPLKEIILPTVEDITEAIESLM